MQIRKWKHCEVINTRRAKMKRRYIIQTAEMDEGDLGSQKLGLLSSEGAPAQIIIRYNFP